jgi:hypothetical protein
MRVNMEIKDGQQKTGMFSSVPVFFVNVDAEFSDAEKIALKRSGAMDQVFLSYHLHPSDSLMMSIYEGPTAHVTVEKLVKNSGCNPYYTSMVLAQNAMSEIESQFRLLKQNIDAIDAPKTKSLEF